MNITTTTITTVLPPPSTQVVPWYSILWALVAFALNSMNQPAGCVVGCTTNVSFMLRSSPIVCALDTLMLLAGLIYYRCCSPSLEDAHIRLLHLRFQDDETLDAKPTAQTGRLARWCAFALLLSQVVKLLSYHGLLWSKIIAGHFVLSFIISEVILGWPRTPAPNCPNTEPALQMSGPLSPCYNSIALSVAFMLWFSATASRDLVGQPQDTLLRHLGLVTFTLGALFITFMYVVGILESKVSQERLVSTALLAPLLGIPWAYYAASPMLQKAVTRPVFIQLTTAGLSVGWVLVALFFASIVLKRIVNTPIEGLKPENGGSEDDGASESKRLTTRRIMTELTLGWYFLALHVVTAALYLKYSYEPAGTGRPAWSEPLG